MPMPNSTNPNSILCHLSSAPLSLGRTCICSPSPSPLPSKSRSRSCAAARARIKTGENNYYPVGANIEFACEILAPSSSQQHHQQQHHSARASAYSSSRRGGAAGGLEAPFGEQQIYWYHNGNLINYAKTLADFGGAGHQARQNFTIEWDAASQLSRLRLANIQLADGGNYTCKPAAAEPATVRLFVKSLYRRPRACHHR